MPLVVTPTFLQRLGAMKKDRRTATLSAPRAPSVLSEPDTAIAARTLVTAGFTITNSRRQRAHIEIHCERADAFGISVSYLIAVCNGDAPPTSDVSNIQKESAALNRTLVVVCKEGGPTWISWKEFLNSLGGAVPSWRAVGPNYPAVLNESAGNKTPKGQVGEAWRIFEEAVADGFEFIFGHRVIRLGGKSRGKRVSDMISQTPDQRVLVLDAKAAREPFDVQWPELRPIVEYTKAQIERQRGHSDVHGAVLIAKEFAQDGSRLGGLAADFLADVRVPLTFVRAEDLADLVSRLGEEPRLRSSINWGKIFCRGGLIVRRLVDQEIIAARSETYPRGRPIKN